MRIDNRQLLHVVSEKDVTAQNIENLFDAFRGGLDLKEVAIFTDRAEAEEHALRQDLLGRGAAALRDIHSGPLETIVKSLESDGNTLSTIIRLAREQRILDTLKKCGV